MGSGRLLPFRVSPETLSALAQRGGETGVTLRAPAWRITVEGVDVTRDVTPMVTRVRYTDHAHGQSDELEITFEDSDALWRGPWRPEKGKAITLAVGYAGEPPLECGRFEADTIDSEWPPLILVLRALSAGTVPTLRSPRTRSFRKTTLAAVVRQVAAEHKLTMQGGTDADAVALEHVSQRGETDLEFLHRLAEEHGYSVGVRGNVLSWVEIDELKGAPPAFTLRPEDTKAGRLGTTTRGVYKACRATGHLTKKKQPIDVTVAAPGIKVGDIYRLSNLKVSSIAHAEARARSALRRANGNESPGSVTLEGNPTRVAGVNGRLTGFGAYDGIYHVGSSTHVMDRETGYETELEFEGVG